MKKTTFFTELLLLFVAMASVGACSSEAPYVPEIPQEDGPRACTMTFIGQVPGFDRQANGAATRADLAWKDGDKIYITFTSGKTKVQGDATYSTTTGKWSLYYYGELAAGEKQSCEVRFFVNAASHGNNSVTLNSSTEIYEDVAATYSYSTDELSVTGSLTPKTGRIRFKGTKDTKVKIMGLVSYSSYSLSTNSFNTPATDGAMTATVDNSGYTPYIYSYFPNDEKRLFLVNGDNAYTRTCSADVLKAGESGYMAVPTQDAASGWQKGFVIPVNGVLLRMQPVTGFSSGDFFMAETETTEELWGAVDKTAAATSTPTLPVDNISYPAVASFIKNLNSLTGFTFSLPATGQWEYARKGGKYSKNYTYAGSNTIGDVCWYSGNASAKQPVGTKMPNELGLFDLIGNVSEFSSQLYYSSYPYVLGGNYTYSSSDNFNSTTIYLSNASSTSTSCKEAGVGFRLILAFP